MEKICGIYCIENLINGKKYIGLTGDIYLRWSDHIELLGKKEHYSNHLQSSYNKYGKDNFKFYIMEECNEDDLREREKYWIKFYKTKDNKFGYNMTDGGDGCLNPRAETRKKMSEWVRTKKIKDILEKFSFKKGSQNWLGKHHTEESKKKISEFRKNMIMSEECKKNIALGLIGIKRIKNTSSKYVGVTFDKRSKKWITSIFYNKKYFRIGTFQYETEAAMAYNETTLEFYGWKARLNIIPQEEIDSLWNLESEV